jgi:hypothetical protein
MAQAVAWVERSETRGRRAIRIAPGLRAGAHRGLKIPAESGGDAILIANAAVIVSLDDGKPG